MDGLAEDDFYYGDEINENNPPMPGRKKLQMNSVMNSTSEDEDNIY
jgi:hypothetical protein